MFKNIRYCSVLVAGLLLSAAAFEVRAESQALLIGVGKYQDSRADLPGIGLDLEIMRKVAGRLGYTDSQITVLKDEQVIRGNIDREFARIAKLVSPDDKVLIYYSGHGTQVEDRDGDEDDNYDEALTLHNMHNGPDRGVLVDDDLNLLLKSIPSKHKTLIVDACCSGSAAKSLDLSNTAFPKGTKFFVKSSNCPAGRRKAFGVAEVSSLDDIVYLSAASDTQSSLATSEGSIFTLAVADAFRAGASISPAQLQASTDQFIEQRVSAAQRFNPNLLGDEELLKDSNNFLISDKPPASDTSRPSYLRDWRDIVKAAEGSIQLYTPKPTYNEGEKLSVLVKMPFDGYLNLIAIDPKDNMTLLYPNRFSPDNRVTVGDFNLPEAKYTWPAQPPHGVNSLVVIATRKPLSFYDTSITRDQTGSALAAYLVPPESATSSLSGGQGKAGIKYHASVFGIRTCTSGC